MRLDTLKQASIEPFHHVVGPGLTAGENNVGMPVQPLAGRPAGCQHLVNPSLPWPQPDRVDMGVEDEMNGNHQPELRTEARYKGTRLPQNDLGCTLVSTENQSERLMVIGRHRMRPTA